MDDGEQPWKSMGKVIMREEVDTKTWKESAVSQPRLCVQADPSGSNQIIVEPVKHLFIK